MPSSSAVPPESISQRTAISRFALHLKQPKILLVSIRTPVWLLVERQYLQDWRHHCILGYFQRLFRPPRSRHSPRSHPDETLTPLFPNPQFLEPFAWPLISSRIQLFASISAQTFCTLSLFSLALSRFSLVLSRRSARKHLLTSVLRLEHMPMDFHKKPRAWHSSRAVMTSSQPEVWISRGGDGGEVQDGVVYLDYLLCGGEDAWSWMY